ncbi:hypothetical protein [Edaphobacter dinghuensis]|nr:hypothetical protein [Edaphobacter dinghuensis]
MKGSILSLYFTSPTMIGPRICGSTRAISTATAAEITVAAGER